MENIKENFSLTFNLIVSYLRIRLNRRLKVQISLLKHTDVINNNLKCFHYFENLFDLSVACGIYFVLTIF